MKSSKLVYSVGFPKLKAKSSIVIFDQQLNRQPKTKKWLSQFSNKISVKAGESLKDLDQFPVHVKAVLKLAENESVRDLTIVAVGGGSVGDFAGFLASVLKRGVRLIHIPSTWLAALDSAHGGKTALNVGALKNQIGSFYPADQVLISKSILATQSEQQLHSAYGELFKIALIQGGSFSNKVLGLKKLDENSLWRLLPDAVRAKMKIVKLDPYETKKLRYFLNLGHTFGHALELDSNIPHGEAVLLGTQFALAWSCKKNILSNKKFDELSSKFLVKPKLKRKLKLINLKKALKQDKKLTSGSQINFVFLKRPGQCSIRKVKVTELITEAKRQGWV